MIRAWDRFRHDVCALAELAWPSSCGACGAWGAMLCQSCAVALQPRQVRPHPVWSGDLPVYSAAVFDGPVRKAITAFKDEGRRDLAPPLAKLLRSAVAQAVADSRERGIEHWVGVLVPSSSATTRRRGRFPLRELVDLSAWGMAPGPRLQVQRRVQDQSHLSRIERLANLEGALRLPPGTPELPGGCGVLVFDDVVTTGATLAAARQVLDPLRPGLVLAATIAART